MSIEELAKAGIATVTHPQISGGRITFYIADTERGLIGPWATVEDAATDAGVLKPPQVPSWELPEDGWEPYTKEES